ncbi:MAG: T9SS type A sorting domain-containing protein [Saprospiraceae bacterium]|nr:T9SS type A sorting domain-containing protein [Saprospiraceae bacterium]MBK8853565.1 T9SS type A sorting domain-containing protein [Saprospiraceae bacterium]MBK9041857.1 T9SS type A sorting domain-containing protein [Saprospiraceae bacterium]
MKIYPALFFIVFLSCLHISAQNIYDARQSVILQATVQVNPPGLVLSWLPDAANGGYKIWRKGKYDLSWGDSIAVLGPTATSWVDTNVVTGVEYEYQVIKSLPAFPYGNGKPNFGTGYLSSGIKKPAVHYRGSVLVVIDSTYKSLLAPEILRLLQDLEEDGWQSFSLYVDRNDKVTNVKSKIKTWADTRQDSNLVVFLLGRVPVPYSGDIAPDGHQNDHRGAWPCDGYYACLEGIWTDNTVNINPPGYRNDNVPGDGKFDNNTFPAKPTLQIGRVDFANMTKFPESELQLLRRYLNKDHNWRMGKMPMMERALVDNNFGDIEGLGEAGWKNFSAMFGHSNVKDIPYRQSLLNQSYMWSYGCGGGGPESASDISNTTNFTTDSLQTAFTMLFGSYFGDWDYPNNFLRAAIASRSCLASTWGNRPVWFFHHMALGEHIGYSTKQTTSNAGKYFPPYYGLYVHSALMGDPTLRMHILPPVKNLEVRQDMAHVQLNWSNQTNVVGYFIYKKQSTDSVYQLLNDTPLTTTFYKDSCVREGLYTYMVRSTELKTSGSGSYYNLSSGVSKSIMVDLSDFSASASFESNLYFDKISISNNSQHATSYFWDFGDGFFSSSKEPVYVYGESGTYNLCLTASNDCSSNTTCQMISMISSLPDVEPQITDVACFGDSTGSILLMVNGGAGGESYSWTGFSNETPFLQNIPAGEYFCTLMSATGKVQTYGPYIVRQASAWTLNEQIMMATQGQANGSISLQPQGGCLPYTFYWNNGDTTATINNLLPGFYCVTIEDCGGCSVEFCGQVEISGGVHNITGLVSYKIYPNPVRNDIILEMKFNESKSVKLDIYDVRGKKLFSDSETGETIRRLWNTEFLSSGYYQIRVEADGEFTIIPFNKIK